MMFNTASSTQLNAPGMAFQFRPDNGFKRKSSSNIHDEYDSGPSVGMERTDSRDAKRRRIPTGNISCSPYPIDLPFHTNSLVPTLIQHVQQPQQQIPQQFSQFSNHASNNILNGQQNQLYTPPLESPGDFQLSCQPIVANGNFDDDMMMDDDCDNTIPATTIDSITTHPRHHSHTAPPSPVTPSLLGVNDYDDNSNPIKWEGTKHKGYPRDAYEDPNANLWTGDRVLRKNMDGQVKGFKMGYMEGCEKCRVRARGHFGHFIMADSI